MTGQTLAEVMFAADRASSAAGNTFAATLAEDPCRRIYAVMADAVTAHLAAILADPDVQYGAGTLHDNAPRDYSDEEAHIWTVGYRAALEYVAERLGCEVQA